MIANILLILHLLGAIVWVGGMAFALLVLRPSLALVDPAGRMAIHREVFRRFFRILWHVVPLVLLTGYAMVFGVYGGFANIGWNVHVMQGTGLLMTFVFLFVALVPWRALRDAGSTAEDKMAAQAVNTIRGMIALNLVLGVITAAVAAWMT